MLRKILGTDKEEVIQNTANRIIKICFVLPIKYWLDDQIKQNEMGGARSTHVEDKHTQRTFVGTDKVKDRLEDVSINWRIILKYICKK
jgi:hypothetical protein